MADDRTFPASGDPGRPQRGANLPADGQHNLDRPDAFPKPARASCEKEPWHTVSVPARPPRPRATGLRWYDPFILLACLYLFAVGTVVAALVLGRTQASVAWGLAASYILCLPVAAWVVRRRTGTSVWSRYFSRRGTPSQARPRIAVIGTGIAIGMALWLFTVGLTALLAASGAKVESNLPDMAHLGAGTVAALAVSIVLIGPLVEEIIFRGMLYEVLLRRWNPWLTFAVVGMVFGLAHFSFFLFPALAVVGGVLAWLFGRSGTLWTTVAAHATFNSISFALALFAIVAQN